MTDHDRDHDELDEARAVVLNMICDRCQREYDWRVGDEPPDELCPSCRLRRIELPKDDPR
jgi:hypothetical protein